MKTVEQLAREAKLPYYYRTGEISNLENLQCFHDLAIAQYRKSLLAGVGEAVAWQFHDDAELGYVAYQSKPPTPEKIAYLKKWDRPAWEPLYTADQMAAAVAIEREKAAKVCDETVAHHYMKQTIPTADEALLVAACSDCAAAIRGQ